MHHSKISSELTTSGLRAPQPSPIRVPRGTRPISDDDDDDDDDDVRLTLSQSRASARPRGSTSTLLLLLLPTKGGQYFLSCSSGGGGGGDTECAVQPLAHLAEHWLCRTRPSRIRAHLPSIRPHQSLLCIRRRRSVHPIPSHPTLPLPLSNKGFMHIYTALVQLFRVSVSASANGRSSSASHDQLVVSSYARPLGATLVAFGMAVLVMGESRHFSFALPCACMRICRRYNTRHAKVFPHSASSAAGALPSRPPQRVSL